MQFREATQSDIDYCAEHSMSRAPKEHPASLDHVVALEHDGKVLGTGGFKLLNPWSAWCWFNWSTAAKNNINVVYRVTKEYMDVIIRRHKLRRVMAAVDPEFPEAVRTIEHLGFTRESEMPNFFGKRDAWMYVRLINEV